MKYLIDLEQKLSNSIYISNQILNLKLDVLESLKYISKFLLETFQLFNVGDNTEAE